jgi:hypothetical protein
MTPQQALEKQIEIYRAMTPTQRLDIALQLHEMACEMSRMGIRRQHPDAGEIEVNRLLRDRIALANGV